MFGRDHGPVSMVVTTRSVADYRTMGCRGEHGLAPASTSEASPAAGVCEHRAGEGGSDIDSGACGGKDTKLQHSSQRPLPAGAVCGSSRQRAAELTRALSHRRQRDPTAAVHSPWTCRKDAAGTNARAIVSSQVQPTNRPYIRDMHVQFPIGMCCVLLHGCVTFYVVVLTCVYDHILLPHSQSVHRRRQAERRADMSVAVHSKITPRPTRSLYTSITLPYLFLCSISPLAVFASRESCLLPPESQLPRLPPPTLLAKFGVLWLA